MLHGVQDPSKLALLCRLALAWQGVGWWEGLACAALASRSRSRLWTFWRTRVAQKL
jgi:hypothetical protein